MVTPTPHPEAPWTGGEVAEGVTCLLAPNPSEMTLEGTNTWLIERPDGVVVVDPGPDEPAHVEQVLAAIAGRPVLALLVTHGHADHVGAGPALEDATGIPLGVVPPAGIRAQPAPGHTADSMVYLLPEQRLALVGDTVLGRGTSVVAWPDGSLGHYLRTLEMLRSLTEQSMIERLAPGHGPVVEAAPVLCLYLRHREERLEQVRAAATRWARTEPELVAALPQRPVPRPGVSPRSEDEVLADSPDRPRDLADAVVDEVYTDVPSKVLRAARLSVLAQLDYLGHVTA